MYVLGGIELVANIPGDDGAFAHILIADKHDFKLLDGAAIAGEADAIAHMIIIKQIIKKNQRPPQSSSPFLYPILTLPKIQIKYIMSDGSSSNNVSQFNKFLGNNKRFIIEKYEEYFDRSITVTALAEQRNTDTALKFIYDIFSFRKYESDPALNNTLRTGLTANIVSFIQNVGTQKGSTDVHFSQEYASQLLKYCIENNEMFAVRYEKKGAQGQSEQPAQPTQQKTEQSIQKSAQQNNVQPTKQTIQQISPKKPRSVVQKSQSIPKMQSEQPQQVEQVDEAMQNVAQKEQAIQKVESHVQKQQKKYFNLNHRTIQKTSNEMSCSKEFNFSQRVLPKQDSAQIIRKQLRNIFEFYCKQQQNVTPNSTFDNINLKCQTMSLGKFLFFAGAVDIIPTKDKVSSARLDRNVATSLFKRFAQGHSLVDFKVFMAIMEELHKKDDTIYARMGLGDEGLRGKNKVVQKLKHFNLPFYTKDQEGREKSPHGQTFVPKLTSHSGKIEETLREELIQRRERPYEDQAGSDYRTIFRGRVQSQLGYHQDNKDSTVFTLKLGENSFKPDRENIKILSKLFNHEQNDKIFLKDYYVPARKSVQKNGKYLSGTFDESDRYNQNNETAVSKQLGKHSMDFTPRPTKETLHLPQIKPNHNPMLSSERRSPAVNSNLSYNF